MENQFRTVTLFGKGRRYGAQLPGLDAPVWGDTPAELFTNLATAVQRMSPSATRADPAQDGKQAVRQPVHAAAHSAISSDVRTPFPNAPAVI